MKKLLVLLSVIVSSCATQKDFSNYSMSGWSVYKDSTEVAKVVSTEIELSPKGKMVQEISLTVKDISKYGEAEDIVRYMGTQFPKAKIELNLDGIQKFE